MHAKLLVVRGQPQGKLLVFPSGEYVIGRGDECHIRPNSSWVSRQHCILHVGDDGIHLKDLGSTNGTLVNGRRIMSEHYLNDGDDVQIGPLVFRLSLAETVDLHEALPGETAEHCIDTAETRALTDTDKSRMAQTDEIPSPQTLAAR